jgi:broad specificity phosphatase PhoE
LKRQVELRRHTDHKDDVLTPDGVRAALEVGAGLKGPYRVVISSGAHRATQTAACFLAGMGQSVQHGVVVDRGFYSTELESWMRKERPPSSDVESLRALDVARVDGVAKHMGEALRSVLDSLPDGSRALIVGHTPFNELAVYGLTGLAIAPLAKGAGVMVTQEGARLRVEKVS